MRLARMAIVLAVAFAMLATPLIPAAPAAAQVTSGVGVIGPFLPVSEGQRATFTIAVTNAPSPAPITLKFSTVDSPSFLVSSLLAEPDRDYSRVVGRAVTLNPANDYRATVEVQTHDDADLEGAEAFVGRIHDLSSNATAVVGTAVAVINASDPPSVTTPTIPKIPTIPPITIPKIPNLGSLTQLPRVGIDDTSVLEGTGGQSEMVFTVHRSGNTLVPARVVYRTVDGSAVAGQDYTHQQGTVQFGVGGTTATVRVPVTADDSIETNETFSLELTFAYGATISDRTGTATIFDDDQPPPPPGAGTTPVSPRGAVTRDGGGYWLHDRTGQAMGFGSAQPVGNVTAVVANNSARIVAMATNQAQSGVWLLDSRGGVYSLGAATFFGSVPGLVNSGALQSLPETVDISAAPAGDGYTVLSRDGGVFTFGNARFFGSLHTLVGQGALARTPEAVAIAYTPSGNGYWITSADGGVFTFGDAGFFGSMPGLRAQGVNTGSPRIVSIAAYPGGRGYALVDESGGVFTFGAATFHGSVPGLVAAKAIANPVRVFGAEYTAAGNGYWIFGRTGGVYTFGSAPFFGAAQFADDDPPPARAQGNGRRGKRR